MASVGAPGKGKTQSGAGRHTPKPRKGTKAARNAAAIRESREG